VGGLLRDVRHDRLGFGDFFAGVKRE